MKIDERLDELIFDYLEGNLSAEEKEAVELLSEGNEAFALQMRQWKKAYIVEPLSVVSDLQNRLLIFEEDRRPGKEFFRYGVMILFIAFLFLPGDVEKKPVTFPRPITAIPRTTPTVKLDTQKNTTIVNPDKALPVKGADSPLPSERHVQSSATLTGRKSIEEFEILPDMRPLPALVEIPKPENLNVNVFTSVERNAGHINLKKKLSRAEERRLRKQQRELYDYKRTKEFLSGNVPYVVPLNDKNF